LICFLFGIIKYEFEFSMLFSNSFGSISILIIPEIYLDEKNLLASIYSA
jgi:hypothetical protein